MERERARYAGVWASLFTLLLLASAARAQSLPRSTPEAEGVSSAGVRAFIEAADQRVITMHSFMLVRHGKVVAEAWWKPQTAETLHIMNSLSKSFTSTAVGLAIAEGKLGLDDPVLKFFPEDAPAAPSENLKAMRVRDLLSMSCGHDSEVRFSGNTPWTKSFLAHPVPNRPGTKFIYNTPGSYMLSAIVQKATGQTVLEYLRPRLFEPLGIRNPEWAASPQGITIGGYGLKIRTEDVAKFGQLYLQKGKWNGRQLVPAAWVEAATTKQVANDEAPSGLGKPDWQQGYGFQFWRSQNGAYRGDGAAGQFCVVLPQHDAVIAITAATGDMQAQLNLVWQHLLPALQAAPLAVNAAEQERLRQVCAQLTAGVAIGGGKVFENLSLSSAILKKEKRFSIYLPAGYEESDKRYPVLYLLHGGGDDNTAWVRKGDLRIIADAAIREGKADPMIIVMPDAEMTFYLNHVRGEYQYEDFFFQELIPHIEKNYRCRTEKKDRAIAGLSMGGFGSLLYALHRPEMFASCYAMSAAVRTDEEINKMPLAEFQRRYKAALGEVKEGEPRITEFWNRNSVLSLMKRMPEAQKKAVRYFLDCGDDDFLYTGNSLLHIVMRDNGIPHEYRVRDGAHTWDYWRGSLPEALRFVTQGMR